MRGFENRVLRGKFEHKRQRVMEYWRKSHNVELNNVYSSPNITRVITSRNMRWVGLVVLAGSIRKLNFSKINVMGRAHLGVLSIDWI
jgi:hypothetical protein